ncbi:C-glycoside deglycosidase beta subunit domain-containing protein [Actinoplanes philippinensis]|uniref:C-glycoside deglycosidase beta subunit domain-containing protein n=1 Tax=Actinoplanes philippinensis TaxID=35752 RepID=UPI0033C15CDA
MLDRDIIQSRGFRNVPGGFQFRLRMPNYRGVPGSLIEGVEVSVDDELHFDRDAPRWTLQGRELTLAELSVSTDVRWQLDEAAIITVAHPGGLRPGVHLLRVGIALQAPYIPAEFQPSIFPAERKVTLLS